MNWISQVTTMVLCVGSHQQIFTHDGIAIMSRACAFVYNHLCLQMTVLAPSPLHLLHIILIPKSYSLLISMGCLERAHDFICNCFTSENTISLCKNLPHAVLSSFSWAYHACASNNICIFPIIVCWDRTLAYVLQYYCIPFCRGIFNPLNAELNPICHLLALLGAHHILHISRVRVKLPHRSWGLYLYANEVSRLLKASELS
jgi:hypothetical protein